MDRVLNYFDLLLPLLDKSLKSRYDCGSQITLAHEMKLHIGGEEAHPDWKILNVQVGTNVDYVGNCTDLSQFQDNSVEAIYASHVFEHLDYKTELSQTLRDCRRILMPQGKLMVSVPNLGVLCQLFVAEGLSQEQRLQIMRMMFGGQVDAYDYHKVGIIEEFLVMFFAEAQFSWWERVNEFSIFDDASSMRLGEHLISLNMIATK
jgi:predicted SAM-dependent methyltransferase